MIVGESVFVGGTAIFVSLTRDDLARREFIKGGDLILLLSMQGRTVTENKFNCCINSKQGFIRMIRSPSSPTLVKKINYNYLVASR